MKRKHLFLAIAVALLFSFLLPQKVQASQAKDAYQAYSKQWEKFDSYEQFKAATKNKLLKVLKKMY